MTTIKILWVGFICAFAMNLFAGCQNSGSVEEATSAVDLSKTIFTQFKEDGFSGLEEAEKSAVDMLAKRDYKAMIDHSLADGMLEGALGYDGSTDFYEFFMSHLVSRLGDNRGVREYNNPKLVQAFPAQDGMSGHYVYSFTGTGSTESMISFAVVKKNDKFLLDFSSDTYIFEKIFFKFTSNQEIMKKLTPDQKNVNNVILPIALMKSANQKVARPWKMWMAIASQNRVKMSSITLETDEGNFKVPVNSKLGPEGGIIWIESPQKFGKIKKATIADKEGRMYELKILE